MLIAVRVPRENHDVDFARIGNADAVADHGVEAAGILQARRGGLAFQIDADVKPRRRRVSAFAAPVSLLFAAATYQTNSLNYSPQSPAALVPDPRRP